MPCTLSASSVSKSFNGVNVVQGVSIHLGAGDVQALVGENGAGKSTVIKILSGVYQPDEGSVYYEGRAVKVGSPAHAHSLGIYTVHQEPAMMPQLSVSENVFMGSHPTRRLGMQWVSRRDMNAQAASIFKRLEIPLDVTKPAGSLTIAQQQMVEIAKALVHQVKVLILDEPTATLSSHETQILFRIVRLLQAEGTAVLFVSHRLDEVFALASSVTVMRDGINVGNYGTDTITEADLVKLMIGRDVVASHRRTWQGTDEIPILEVRNLSRRPWFSDVSFKLFAGEIVGLAGLVGAGRTNVAEALFGVSPAETGEVFIRGSRCSIKNVQQALKQGIIYVPEDRHKHGIAIQVGIMPNLTLPNLAFTSRLGLLDSAKESALASRMVQSLGVKSHSLHQPVSQLSGGNQQKVVFGKWLARSPNIILLDEPTRGVDVGAKEEIYRIIKDLADRGSAILVISSDLPEILGLADRILVMKEGEMVADVGRADMSEEVIMLHATGVSK